MYSYSLTIIQYLWSVLIKGQTGPHYSLCTENDAVLEQNHLHNPGQGAHDGQGWTTVSLFGRSMWKWSVDRFMVFLKKTF